MEIFQLDVRLYIGSVYNTEEISVTLYQIWQIQKILSEGVQLWQRFFSWWGVGGSKYLYKRAIIGPPADRHLNGVSLAFLWWLNIECWPGSFVIFQGIWTRIAKKPYIFVIFQRGGGGVRTPGPPMQMNCHWSYCNILNNCLLSYVQFNCTPTSK